MIVIDAKYNCEAEKETGRNITSVDSNNDFIFEGAEDIKVDDINFINDGEININSKTIQIKNSVILQEGTIINNNTRRFTIKGTLEDIEKIKNNSRVIFEFKIDENKNKKNINCNIKKKAQDDYQIKCIPEEDLNLNIDLAKGLTNNNNLITLNMTEGNNKVKITGNSINKIYKQSSRTQSGGAIAGIVIAYVIALIAITSIAIFKRKPVASTSQNSSVVVGISP